MRIDSIKLHNFRLYKDAEIIFKELNEDIHIIIGQNGSGKTTLLNAMFWCLYDSEPHVYSKEESLSIENKDELNKNNGNLDVFVEINTTTDYGSKLKFKRTLTYKNFNINYNEFIVDELKSTGETSTHKGPTATDIVESVMPKNISEFFFFDGEQLENYFSSKRVLNVKNHISILSEVSTLESLFNHLKIKSDDYKREAGKLDNNVDNIQKKINELETAKTDALKRYNNIKLDLNISQEKYDELRNKLYDKNNFEVELKNLDTYKHKLNDLNQRYEDKKIQMNNNLFKSTPSILLYDAIKYTLNSISQKKDNLPKYIDEDEIKNILNEGKCSTCNQELSNEAVSYLKNLINEYKFSSQGSKRLLKLDMQLKNNLNHVHDYGNVRDAYIEDLNLINNNINELNNNIQKIGDNFENYDKNKLKDDFNNYKKLEQYILENNRELGSLKEKISNLSSDLDELNNKLIKSKQDNKKVQSLISKYSVCNEALNIVDKTINKAKDLTRESIENFTKKTFFDLIWKKKTYSDVKINENYRLELVHADSGGNALATASATEKELLVLAFTLGVHSIAGFNSFLMIDSPLGRVSDDTRVNFAEVLFDVSKTRQIIMIVTPSEFSEDISPIFNNIPKHKIILSDSEKETNFKEVF